MPPPPLVLLLRLLLMASGLYSRSTSSSSPCSSNIYPILYVLWPRHELNAPAAGQPLNVASHSIPLGQTRCLFM
jgi:hypothetical protein